MTGLPLFDTPIARRNDPPSSAAAAAWQNATGKRWTQAGRVLYAVDLWPGRTYRELAQLTGMDAASVNRRLSDLRAKGLVEVREPRECSVCGVLAAENWPRVIR